MPMEWQIGRGLAPELSLMEWFYGGKLGRLMILAVRVCATGETEADAGYQPWHQADVLVSEPEKDHVVVVVGENVPKGLADQLHLSAEYYFTAIHCPGDQFPTAALLVMYLLDYFKGESISSSHKVGPEQNGHRAV